jgi:hypothetical protein
VPLWQGIVLFAKPTLFPIFLTPGEANSRGATVREAPRMPGGGAFKLIHGALNVIPREEDRIVMGVQAE